MYRILRIIGGNMTDNKIIQKSIHSKASRTYYHYVDVCSNTGCSNHNNSGYNNAYSYGYNNHSNSSCNWGIWYDAWGGCSHSNGGSSGCNNHGNGGCNNHSNSGYSNYTNSYTSQLQVQYSDKVDTTTWNPQATANKVILSKAFVNMVKIPTIHLRWATGSTTEIRPDFSGFNRECTAIRFYLETSSSKTFDESNFTLLGEVNSTSSVYNWDVSKLATDSSSIYCRIAITGYNGSWSALLSNGKLNAQDKREQLTSGGTNPKITVESWTDVAPSYMLSDIFKIYYYKAPTWLAGITKASMDQLETEVNKAKNKVDLESYVFSDRPIIQNFSWVKATDMNQNIDAATNIKQYTSKSLPGQAVKDEKVTLEIINSLHSLLDDMGSK